MTATTSRARLGGADIVFLALLVFVPATVAAAWLHAGSWVFVLAALALIVYVRIHGGGSSEIAMVEISAEGEVTTILETADGPIVLLAEENGS